jgi:ABC-type uncharacterized transport system substrate-binding protein
LARPGGNATGLSTQSTDLAGKRLEILREVVPGLRRLAILANVGNPAATLEMNEVQAAAHTLGLEVITLEIRRGEDIAPAFEALKGRAEALYVAIDALVNASRIRINTSALGARLPTMPGDIPVEQPTKFDFVVNLTTAKTLGLDMPPSLLARADELIE